MSKIDGRTLVDVLFVLLVFTISLVPFIPWKGWDGYAPGTFLYRDETYYIRYSDKTIGSDKPHIFLFEGWPVRTLIDAIEFSDNQAYVNGSNLYKTMECYGRLEDNGLTVYYSDNNSSLKITKTVTVTDKTVIVKYESNEPVKLQLTFWRWYFTAVDGRDFRGVLLPIKIDPKDKVEFEFTARGKTYKGILEFSQKPSTIEVWRDLKGLNKILIKYVGSNLTIKVHVEMPKESNFNLADKDLVFPLMAAALGLAYLKVGRHEILVKTRLNWPRR